MAITVVKQKVIDLMSLILAIPCSDGIVVAADGRRTDYDNPSKPLPDIMKIFGLTNNSAVLIAGGGLIDALDKYMDELVHTVRAKGNTNVVDIAHDVREIIDRRNWAEWKENYEKSHMEAIVVGYDDSEPNAFAILDNRQFTRCWGCVFGSWDKAKGYLAEHASTDWRHNTAKTAKITAIEMLTLAGKANDKEIGGDCAIWHVYPDKTRQLKTDEVTRLRKRYGDV